MFERAYSVKSAIEEGKGIQIVGLGACTPLGRRAATSAAAIRAGISRAREHARWRDSDGDAAVLAYADFLPSAMPAAERMTALALSACQEAVAALPATKPSVSVLVALPDARPGGLSDKGLKLQNCLRSLVAQRARVRELVFYTQGDAGGILALSEAMKRLSEDPRGLCLVGGVDSFIDVDTMDYLETRSQLKTATHRWGFVPGEAAAFCLLATPSAASLHCLPDRGRLMAAATAREPTLAERDSVYTGEALSAACRAALDPEADAERVCTVVCDLNGERQRADELGFMLARLGERFAAPVKISTPAEGWGNVGAASATLFMTLAGCVRHEPGRQVLLCASSEHGLRGAARVYLPGNRP